jgi:hypothetical protein
MLPDPIFRGEVSSSWLHVAQFREATGRDRASLTVFDASMDPAPEGGTTLRGTVGPKRNNAMTMLAVAAVFAVAGLGAFVGGVVDLAHHHFRNSLPFMLVPVGFISFAIFVIAPNKRSVRVMLENDLALLQDITKLLDATSTFPD